jgi:hypothetical protein
MQDNSVKDHLQKTFDIDYRSEMDGEAYVGQFTVKKLSIRDLGRLGTRRSQLNGGMYYDEENPGVGIDEQTHMTNNMIAHLEISVIQAPTWWDLEEIYDIGLLSEVFKHIAEFENSFFRLKETGQADNDSRSSQANSDGSSTGSRVAGHVKEVGGGAIPSSLDP